MMAILRSLSVDTGAAFGEKGRACYRGALATDRGAGWTRRKADDCPWPIARLSHTSLMWAATFRSGSSAQAGNFLTRASHQVQVLVFLSLHRLDRLARRVLL